MTDRGTRRRDGGGESTPLAVGLGEALRVRREQLGLSQAQVAARAALGRGRVGDLERGEHNPSLETLARLADALATPLWQLLRDAEQAR